MVLHPVTFADRPPLRSLAGHRHRISGRASALANWFYGISGLEQCAIAQHGMYDDSEAAGERDPGLSETVPLRDLERPALQRGALLGARQNRVGRFVEQLANGPVRLLGHPARPVELARLVPELAGDRCRSSVIA